MDNWNEENEKERNDEAKSPSIIEDDLKEVEELRVELVEHGLKGTKRMGVQEMVVMFLKMVGYRVGNRMIQERFRRDGE
ncbi:hypothetical protein PIB30_049341 [Stylosanthes scabra]|uniref:DUF8040 domain-containing protein n=1 Tax=Stylosanthes scabra TaxID=79078 RepID=A0ABU6ZG27_9FABA|nr:hypothetical protein [Stylosanthes scabra]